MYGCEYMKRIYLNCRLINEDDSDLRSNEHYDLSSSESKAWKKFTPVRALNPWPLPMTGAVLFQLS